MIIKRSYVTLKKLYMTDPFSKEVLDAAFADAGGTASDVWKKNTYTRLFNATMGCCIPNFGMICEAFKKLDEEHPYDNGLTAKDVDHGDVFAWRDDGKVVLALCDKKGNIVGVAKAHLKEGGESTWGSRKNHLNINMFPD